MMTGINAKKKKHNNEMGSRDFALINKSTNSQQRKYSSSCSPSVSPLPSPSLSSTHHLHQNIISSTTYVSSGSDDGGATSVAVVGSIPTVFNSNNQTRTGKELRILSNTDDRGSESLKNIEFMKVKTTPHHPTPEVFKELDNDLNAAKLCDDSESYKSILRQQQQPPLNDGKSMTQHNHIAYDNSEFSSSSPSSYPHYHSPNHTAITPNKRKSPKNKKGSNIQSTNLPSPVPEIVCSTPLNTKSSFSSTSSTSFYASNNNKDTRPSNFDGDHEDPKNSSLIQHSNRTKCTRLSTSDKTSSSNLIPNSDKKYNKSKNVQEPSSSSSSSLFRNENRKINNNNKSNGKSLNESKNTAAATNHSQNFKTISKTSASDLTLGHYSTSATSRSTDSTMITNSKSHTSKSATKNSREQQRKRNNSGDNGVDDDCCCSKNNENNGTINRRNFSNDSNNKLPRPTQSNSTTIITTNNKPIAATNIENNCVRYQSSEKLKVKQKNTAKESTTMESSKPQTTTKTTTMSSTLINSTNSNNAGNCNSATNTSTINNEPLAQVLITLKEQNKNLIKEIEDLRIKLEDAEGDLKLVQCQMRQMSKHISSNNSASASLLTSNNSNKNIVRLQQSPKHQNLHHSDIDLNEKLLNELEFLKEKVILLEREIQTLLDEKEELLLTREDLQFKNEQLNDHLLSMMRYLPNLMSGQARQTRTNSPNAAFNNTTSGNRNDAIISNNIDALYLENRYLKEKIKSDDAEKKLLLDRLETYRKLVDCHKQAKDLIVNQNNSNAISIGGGASATTCAAETNIPCDIINDDSIDPLKSFLSLNDSSNEQSQATSTANQFHLSDGRIVDVRDVERMISYDFIHSMEVNESNQLYLWELLVALFKGLRTKNMNLVRARETNQVLGKRVDELELQLGAALETGTTEAIGSKSNDPITLTTPNIGLHKKIPSLIRSYCSTDLYQTTGRSSVGGSRRTPLSTRRVGSNKNDDHLHRLLLDDTDVMHIFGDGSCDDRDNSLPTTTHTTTETNTETPRETPIETTDEEDPFTLTLSTPSTTQCCPHSSSIERQLQQLQNEALNDDDLVLIPTTVPSYSITDLIENDVTMINDNTSNNSTPNTVIASNVSTSPTTIVYRHHTRMTRGVDPNIIAGDVVVVDSEQHCDFVGRSSELLLLDRTTSVVTPSSSSPSSKTKLFN